MPKFLSAFSLISSHSANGHLASTVCGDVLIHLVTISSSALSLRRFSAFDIQQILFGRPNASNNCPHTVRLSGAWFDGGHRAPEGLRISPRLDEGLSGALPISHAKQRLAPAGADSMERLRIRIAEGATGVRFPK